VNYYSVEGDMVYDGTSYYEVTAIQQAQRQPGSLKALSALVSSAVCPEGQNGFFMDVTYQVMDNSTPPQPHQVQGLAVQEDITNQKSSAGGFTGAPPDTGWKSIPSATDGSGQFHDNPLGSCSPYSPASYTATQLIGLGNGATVLRTNLLNFYVTGPGKGILTNGSDATVGQ
jgi:hypothetical protein